MTPSAATQIGAFLERYAELQMKKQLQHLGRLVKRLARAFYVLHKAILHQRKTQITEAYSLWQKCRA